MESLERKEGINNFFLGENILPYGFTYVIITTDVIFSIEGSESMSNLPKISEAEWEVMKIFWSKSVPCTANEVVDELEGCSNWKPNTIKTLITRLVKKGALGFNEVRRIYLYYPLVSEEECLKAETKSFVRRVFGGALKPMLVTFLQDEKLSKQEIEELKRILDGRQE